ncbi:MAG: DUF4249 family protein [Bacteroidota bacterium]
MLLTYSLNGCDGTGTDEAGQLVVEAFVRPDEVPPSVLLRQTQALEATSLDGDLAGLDEAELTLEVEGRTVRYEPAGDGLFVPAGDQSVLPAGRTFSMAVRWAGGEARAQDRIPPPIRLDSVAVRAPETPVEAVLIDSLGGPAASAFVYLIEVELSWVPTLDPDSLYWVRAQLQSEAALSSGVVDLFLRTEEVKREVAYQRQATGSRRWTGVYALAVETPATPLPQHTLRVAVLRGTEAYARFLSSGDAPERREPVTNVEGGLGVAVGVALDTLRLPVSVAGLPGS